MLISQSVCRIWRAKGKNGTVEETVLHLHLLLLDVEYDCQDFRLIMVMFNKSHLGYMVLGPRLGC